MVFEMVDGRIERRAVGLFGRTVLAGYRAAVAGMARAGLDVIVDEVMLSAEDWEGWLVELAGLDVTWVAVDLPLEATLQRERERGDRVIGMAAAQFDVVHSFATYDIRVDTGRLTLRGSGGRDPSLKALPRDGTRMIVVAIIGGLLLAGSAAGARLSEIHPLERRAFRVRQRPPRLALPAALVAHAARQPRGGDGGRPGHRRLVPQLADGGRRRDRRGAEAHRRAGGPGAARPSTSPSGSAPARASRARSDGGPMCPPPAPASPRAT